MAEISVSTTRPARRILPLGIVLPAIVVGFYILAAAIGPILLGFNPVATSLADRLKPPMTTLASGSLSLLGTDAVGRDLLAQILAGARISLAVGAATLVLASLIGVTLGVIAGYRGGWIDAVVMRVADIQLGFPSILLAVLVAAVIGPSLTNVILVLAVTRWVVFARVARAQTLTVKARTFVDASRTLGATDSHIIINCILPALVAPILVVATVQFGLVIVAEASLSFLGLGLPVGIPTWGGTISAGRNYLANAWWISTMPGIALSILVICVGILGDTLRDRLDPNLITR